MQDAIELTKAFSDRFCNPTRVLAVRDVELKDLGRFGKLPRCVR